MVFNYSYILGAFFEFKCSPNINIGVLISGCGCGPHLVLAPNISAPRSSNGDGSGFLWNLTSFAGFISLFLGSYNNKNRPETMQFWGLHTPHNLFTIGDIRHERMTRHMATPCNFINESKNIRTLISYLHRMNLDWKWPEGFTPLTG